MAGFLLFEFVRFVEGLFYSNMKGVQMRSSLVACFSVFVLLIAASPAAAGSSDGLYNIRSFGAVGDGKTLNTEAFRKAVEAAGNAGGGTVLVPPGTYLTGTVQLYSHICLRLEAGAVLKGSPNVRDYRVPGETETFAAGARDTATIGLITARNAVDVAIIGPGAIDGNGTSFMDLNTRHSPVDYNPAKTRQGARFGDPGFGIADGPVRPHDRPERMLLFNACRNLVLSNVVLLDAPCWTVHFAECDGVQVTGVRILNNLLVPNSDGIHSTASRNINITNCDIRAGDDGIIVSGLGGGPEVAAENVTVTNCTIVSRSAGIRVGYGESNIRNCTFQNLVITSSNRGLGVFARDNGSISNILFSNIIIETRLHTGHWWGKGEPIHVSAIGQTGKQPVGKISNVRFENIQAKSETGIVVYGVAESVIQNLWFDRVQLEIVNGPLAASYGGNFDLRPTSSPDTSIFQHDIPALYAGYVEGLKIRDFKVTWGEGLQSYFSDAIECENFDNVDIEGFEGRQQGAASAAINLRRGRGVRVRDGIAGPGTTVFLRLTDIQGDPLLANNDTRAAKIAVEGGVLQ